MRSRFFSTVKPLHVVFFPGTGCDQRIFQKITKQFPDQAVIFHYEEMRNEGTLNQLSMDCAERLQKMIGKEKVVAVGHSLGATFAAKTVEQKPGLFVKLISINSRYSELSASERQVKNAIIKKMSRYTEEEFMKLLSRPFFQNQEADLTSEELDVLIDGAKAIGVNHFIQHIRFSLEPARINYSRISDLVDMTVIEGEDDRVISNSGWKNSGLNIKLITRPGGHLIPLRHPDLIVDEIKHDLGLNHVTSTPFSTFN